MIQRPSQYDRIEYSLPAGRLPPARKRGNFQQEYLLLAKEILRRNSVLVHTPTRLQKTSSCISIFAWKFHSFVRHQSCATYCQKGFQEKLCKFWRYRPKVANIARNILQTPSNAAFGMCARYFQDVRSKQRKRQRKRQLRIENGTKSSQTTISLP